MVLAAGGNLGPLTTSLSLQVPPAQERARPVPVPVPSAESEPPLPAPADPMAPGQEGANASLSSAARGSRLSSALLSPEEMQRCAKDLRHMAGHVSLKDLRDLRMLHRPPQSVTKVLEALSIILGEKSLKAAGFKKLLADSLLQRLKNFDITSLTPARSAKVQSLLSRPDVRASAISRTCRPCVSVAEWCDCLHAFLEGAYGSRSTDASPAHRDHHGRSAGARGPSAGCTREPAGHNGTRRHPSDKERPKPIIEPELSTLTREQLAFVQELTVTVPGIGSVTFHGTTDCTDLDVQKTVVLKQGYVLVYPDAASKPPPGQGLNKRSTVTMYKCFPPGERVKDGQAMEEYKLKIKEMTEENNACKFIDYDCSTGVWKFQVAHF